MKITKTAIGNHLRRSPNGDVGMYRNGFKDGVNWTLQKAQAQAAEQAKDTQIVCTPAEPVAYEWFTSNGEHRLTLEEPADYELALQVTPLYTTPPDHTAEIVVQRKAKEAAVELWNEAGKEIDVLRKRVQAEKPVIYVDNAGKLQSRVSEEQVEAVLGPYVDAIRAGVSPLC